MRKNLDANVSVRLSENQAYIPKSSVTVITRGRAKGCEQGADSAGAPQAFRNRGESFERYNISSLERLTITIRNKCRCFRDSCKRAMNCEKASR